MAFQNYARFGLLDPDPSEHDRRREAHQQLVDEFRKRDPQIAARALDDHLFPEPRTTVRSDEKIF